MAAGPTLTLNIKPMGRNKINIDWNKVDRMLEAGCDGTEVAATIGIHSNTLYERCEKDNKLSFSDYLATKRASGDRLLRVKQFEIAMTGDKTMLVWLGKQRLGQKETTSIDHTTGGLPMLPYSDWTDEQIEHEIERLAVIRNKAQGSSPAP